jgi:DeoR/GlpR family transcriptional regulator of sugar metabolism
MIRLNERQQRIRQAMAAEGRMGVAALARRFGVAGMTIRRDLAFMERAGLLTRVHGGCVLQSPFVTELSFPAKLQHRRAEKAAIARRAVQLLRPGESVYIDTGTTALHVARALPPELDLKVLTNNLRVAMELFGRPGIEVVVFGGRLGQLNPDLMGEVALVQVTQFRTDVALVGADAFDAGRGEFYAADDASAMVSRMAQQQAERVIVVADSTKAGKRGKTLAGRFDTGVTLVTDDGLREEMRRALRKSGATLVLAACRKEGNGRES